VSDEPKNKVKVTMIYILDTDVFTLSELPDSPEYLRLHARVLQLEDSDILATTIITYEEQTRGWLAYAVKSRGTSHQVNAYARLKRHLETYLHFNVLDFDDSAARVFDELLTRKLRLGAADLKIAAITLSRNALLLSRNLKDFRRIPGLRAEDWTNH
jgi:tRNA(fMet)-specific endonuclease VapC